VLQCVAVCCSVLQSVDEVRVGVCEGSEGGSVCRK